MERFFGPRRDPVHGRKCAKGASLHRNCISMPGMAARGPVFRGVELRHEIDVASHQAQRIPYCGPLPFLELLTLQKGPIASFSVTTAIAWMHVAYCQASLLVAPRRPLRALAILLSPYVEPPCSSCGVNAFETHITLRCNMRVTLVKRCIHTLETLHSLPSPCGAAHRHAPVATRPPRLELPGLGQWGK